MEEVSIGEEKGREAGVEASYGDERDAREDAIGIEAF